MMKETDSLQRFMFENASIRGDIVRLDKTFNTIMQQRNYPPMIRNLLGEALVSCMLLTGSIKFEGQLSLQFQGDHRIPLLLVQCDHLLNMRGYVKYLNDLEIKSYAQAFLQGKMVLTINQYNQPNVYQSVVPIYSTSMSENLTHYFVQSEQIATQVWLAVGETQAAGMMIQLMPGQNTSEREHFWEYAVQLGQTVSNDELLNLDNATLLYRLYHETEIRLFESRLARFKCQCNRDKMQQVLTVLGEQEAIKLIEEKGQIDVSCDFCNNHFVFDPIDITLLFRAS